jgi:hypothetical protein
MVICPFGHTQRLRNRILFRPSLAQFPGGDPARPTNLALEPDSTLILPFPYKFSSQ